MKGIVYPSYIVYRIHYAHDYTGNNDVWQRLVMIMYMSIIYFWHADKSGAIIGVFYGFVHITVKPVYNDHLYNKV